MLRYAVVFLVIALIAAVLGFGGIAAGAAGIAKILFVVFVILAIATFIFGRNRASAQARPAPDRQRAPPAGGLPGTAFDRSARRQPRAAPATPSRRPGRAPWRR